MQIKVEDILKALLSQNNDSLCGAKGQQDGQTMARQGKSHKEVKRVSECESQCSDVIKRCQIKLKGKG